MPRTVEQRGLGHQLQLKRTSLQFEICSSETILLTVSERWGEKCRNIGVQEL